MCIFISNDSTDFIHLFLSLQFPFMCDNILRFVWFLQDVWIMKKIKTFRINFCCADLWWKRCLCYGNVSVCKVVCLDEIFFWTFNLSEGCCMMMGMFDWMILFLNWVSIWALFSGIVLLFWEKSTLELSLIFWKKNWQFSRQF